MIIGTGIDLVEIERIRDVLLRQPAFRDRILTRSERAAADSRFDATAYLASRFAAKEAVAKSLGSGIGQGISFQQIEVLNREDGEPYVRLTGTAKEKADSKGVNSVHISISDTDSHAIAQVILENR